MINYLLCFLSGFETDSYPIPFSTNYTHETPLWLRVLSVELASVRVWAGFVKVGAIPLPPEPVPIETLHADEIPSLPLQASTQHALQFAPVGPLPAIDPQVHSLILSEDDPFFL